MELNYLEAFIAIHTTRSFSNAATMLHLSQPAISRRIGLLEQELGTALFERARGSVRSGIKLTEAGVAFLPHAQRTLAALDDGVEAVRAVLEETQGVLRLAIVGTLASTDLTETLQRFRVMHPKVDLRLSTARSAEVSTMVRQGEAHIGLRYFGDDSTDLQSVQVWEEEQVVVCSAMRQFANEESLSLDDLAGIPWAAYPVGSSGDPFTQVLRRLLMQIGMGSADSTSSQQAETITIDSLTAQKRIIEADFAIGLLPISSIQEELQLGTLRILKIPELTTAVPVVMLHRSDGFLSNAARTLLDLFTDE